MGEGLTGAELKKHIKLAKKQAMNFAWSPGKKEDPVFILHKRKAPKILSKIARIESGNPKVSWGTAEVKGKLMTLTCEKEVPQMAKTMKRYMRSQKVSMNILILDEDGNELESDIEDLPYDPEMDDDDVADDGNAALDDDPEAAEAADDGAPEADDPAEADTEAPPAAAVADGADSIDTELRNRLMAMRDPIEEADDRYGEPLKRMFAISAGHIKKSEFDKAEPLVVKMEKAVAALPPPTQKKSGDIDPKYLAARVKATKAALDEVDDAHKAKKTIVSKLKRVPGDIKDKKYQAAEDALDKIDAALKKLGVKVEETAKPGAQASADSADDTADEAIDALAGDDGLVDAQEKQWSELQSDLQARIDALIANKQGDLAAINRVFGFAAEQAAAGNFAKANAAALRALPLVEQGEAMETTAAAAEAADAAPDGVVNFTKHRLAWRQTRDGLQKQLENLKSAIETATAGVDGLEDLPSKTPVLFTYLNRIDSNLEDALEELVETPEGKDRDTLKKQARSIIDNYRTVLDEPFFKAVDNNGFTSTNIRASALSSLKDVRSALEA